MDLRKLTQEDRDAFLKKDLSEEKINLINKFSLFSTPDRLWVSIKENTLEQPFFKHSYIIKNDIYRALFRAHKLCFGKVNYFCENLKSFSPYIYHFKDGFIETEWWNADFLKHNSSGYFFDFRYLLTITDIEEFNKLCNYLESYETSAT